MEKTAALNSFAGGIPFAITLPKVPDAVNADQMTASQLHAKLQKGYGDMEAGKVQSAKKAFENFRESHRHETI